MLLVITGGAIGLASSLLTMLFNYWLEGMRLRRQWQRDDQLMLRENRSAIENILAQAVQKQQPSPETPDPAVPDSDAAQKQP